MSKHALTRAGLPVDGAERATAEGWTFPARSPSTGEALWDVPDAGVADAEAAAQAAWRAFHETTWSDDRALRTHVLRRFQDALADRSDDLALLLAAETGVPVALRAAHVDAPVAGLLASPEDTPGVTAVVTPATSPLAVALEEIGRVLVSGGTVVLKPAPEDVGPQRPVVAPRGLVEGAPRRLRGRLGVRHAGIGHVPQRLPGRGAARGEGPPLRR
ncbi:MAG TPA: aldehyde dehydrogenase family protein, partial [Nocardioides sp.]